MSEVLVAKAIDSHEADIIMSMLKSYEIDSFYKLKGIGQAMNIIAGVANQSYDIYVPEEDAERAKELLEAEPIEEEPK